MKSKHIKQKILKDLFMEAGVYAFWAPWAGMSLLWILDLSPQNIFFKCLNINYNKHWSCLYKLDFFSDFTDWQVTVCQ